MISLDKVIDVKDKHLLKAFSPILVTLLGIVIEVRALQLLKASIPIFITVLGIVIVGK